MVELEELKKMNDKELNEELKKSSLELLKLRLGVASRQEKGVSELKLLRKHIARIKTVQRMLKTEKAPENPPSEKHIA